AVRTVEARHGRLDILVNNAGVLIDDPTLKASGPSLETWHRTFDTNVFGLIAVTQAFLPLLRRSPAGRIVNLSSILGSIALHGTP
ncbi:SDR family NAD(P)-dependent oxidoreductase, partial [Acinetobacter baumannii]